MDGGVPFSAFLHAAKARLPQGLDEADIAVMLGVSKRGSLLDVGLSRADFVRAFGKGSVPWNGPNFHAPSSAEGWSSLAVPQPELGLSRQGLLLIRLLHRCVYSFTFTPPHVQYHQFSGRRP